MQPKPEGFKQILSETQQLQLELDSLIKAMKPSESIESRNRSFDSKPAADPKLSKEEQTSKIAQYFDLTVEELKAILKQLSTIKEKHGIKAKVGELYSDHSVKFGKANSLSGEGEYFIILNNVKKDKNIPTYRMSNLVSGTVNLGSVRSFSPQADTSGSNSAGKADLSINSANNVNAAYISTSADTLSSSDQYKVTQTSATRFATNDYLLSAQNGEPKFVISINEVDGKQASTIKEFSLNSTESLIDDLAND